jgi:2-polyprenyl-3-methyl-5-hydroxy-6-metoxy-1,4-benzoquinol methylase
MDNQYLKQVRREIDELLPRNIGTVMEIGCGMGCTMNWLKQDRGAKVTIGVDVDEDAAKIAKENCDVFHSINVVNQFESLSDYKNKIDILLLLDILEHLDDPWRFLQDVKELLADNAIVIASIPNVRSIKVIGPLVIRGNWNYVESGNLDKTHLRFFTKSSSIDLFESSGYAVESIVPNGPVSFGKVTTKTGWLVALFNMLLLGTIEGFIANQYLIAAKPS